MASIKLRKFHNLDAVSASCLQAASLCRFSGLLGIALRAPKPKTKAAVGGRSAAKGQAAAFSRGVERPERSGAGGSRPREVGRFA
jgi:hypothetical protein